MIIRAKHQGADVCFRCGIPIRVGDMIDYQGVIKVRHAACQTEQERAIAPYDHERRRYGSPNGAIPESTPTAERRVQPTCATCGKRAAWVTQRPGQAPLCDSCQENARIEKIRRELLRDVRAQETVDK